MKLESFCERRNTKQLLKRARVPVLDIEMHRSYPGYPPDQNQILRNSLLDIIDEFKPTFSSVEEIFFSKNLKTATKVFQARGVILLTLAEKNITIYEPTVTQIKKGVTSSGKADKKQIHTALKLILKLQDIKGFDDSWDAIAAGFVGFSFIPPNLK